MLLKPWAVLLDRQVKFSKADPALYMHSGMPSPCRSQIEQMEADMDRWREHRLSQLTLGNRTATSWVLLTHSTFSDTSTQGPNASCYGP